MSLLTQEQIAKSEMIRETQFLRSELSKAAANDCQTLLDIIDDLQSRHSERKQYTEQEAIEWYSEYYATTPTNKFHARDCAIDALRHFGALKAEP